MAKCPKCKKIARSYPEAKGLIYCSFCDSYHLPLGEKTAYGGRKFVEVVWNILESQSNGNKIKDFRKWLYDQRDKFDKETKRLQTARDARKSKASELELLSFEEEIGRALGSKSTYENCVLYLTKKFSNDLRN